MLSLNRRVEGLAEVFERLRMSKTATAGLFIIIFMVALAVLGPYIAPYDPYKINLPKKLLPPSSEHPLGTDALGRDILSRILVGARYSLTIGVLAVLVGASVGVPIGVVSGYFGGKVDLFIQRIVDILLAFPAILLALILVAVLGIGIENVIIAVGVATVPVYIRLVRGVVLQIREMEYVQAAKAIGLPTYIILFKHILPNAMAPIIVQSTLYLGSAIVIAAALGFLGLGVKPPTPEWGAMLSDGRAYLFNAPHVATFPGIMIFLTVLGFNLLGDGLRDALDPRLRVLGGRLGRRAIVTGQGP